MRLFRTSLADGHAAERRWVDDLRSQGRSVAHGKKLVIGRHNKLTDHVESPDAVALMSVEIKERSLTFSSPKDYPYDTVFVDDMRGLARERIGHIAYVYISKPTGCWVWLTTLDRDDSWTEQVVYDRGRGHDVPTLVCPRRFLRPAEQLTYLLYPHHCLDLVDGDTDMFLHGGGETEEREFYSRCTHKDFRGGSTPSERKAY